LADPKGSVSFSVHYNEALGTIEQYDSVMVADEDGRSIAHIDVAQPLK
jgi:hypothetical protein